MKTTNGSLWPLGMILAVWAVVMAQAVGVWLRPHEPKAALAQCERLQLALAPGVSSSPTRWANPPTRQP